MSELTLTQLAREAETREREIHRLAVWAEDGQAAIRFKAAIRRALLKRSEKEALAKHLALVAGHLRAAQQELVALSKQLQPILSGKER